MIAGLSWQAWLLVIASFAIGLGIELRFYLRHRPRRPGHVPNERG